MCVGFFYLQFYIENENYSENHFFWFFVFSFYKNWKLKTENTKWLSNES